MRQPPTLDFVSESASAGWSDRDIAKLLGFRRFADFEALLKERPAIKQAIQRGRERFIATVTRGTEGFADHIRTVSAMVEG